MSKLPIQWDAKQITVGDKTYDATQHAPILIYPNPLNPKKYVVLNSGFTYREYAYLNNARQVPMLPDWAVVDLRTPPGTQYPGKNCERGVLRRTLGTEIVAIIETTSIIALQAVSGKTENLKFSLDSIRLSGCNAY